MDPVALATALAKSILAQLGKEIGTAAAKEIKARVWGDPERKALERALRRALTELNRSYGDRLAEFDVNDGFWVHEGTPELAKVLVPGVPTSPVRLAERAVDSLGPAASDDERFDRIGLLRPAFKALLDGLDTEVRREAALQGMLGRSDAASTAQATSRIAEHLGAVDATDDDRIAYLRWLIDQHRYLRTVGVVRNTTVQLPLGEVFVGLQAQRDRNPGDRARAWFERERERLATLVAAEELDHTGFEAALDRLQTEYGHRFAAETEQPASQPVLDAARDTAQLLVLGDPGTGKTTLLRYLALTHARALIDGEQVQGRDALFPIYLRIGEYARQGFAEVGIGEFLPGQLRRAECTLPGLADLLRRQLDAGRCLVLMDGLDEIASAELRRGVVTAVVNFVTAHARQGNRFVVTSRIAGYQAAPLPEPFRAVRLQDMDDPTITRFLDVYCREVERAETPGRSAEATRLAGAREAAAIEQALTTNAGVRRLAANPLLLTALVLVHRASGRLPHRRVEAYVEVCNALGRTWRSAQGVAEADLPDERILTRWLTELGWWMHEHRPEGAATRRELLEVLGPLWATHQGIRWDPRLLETADPLGTDAGLGVTEFVDKADTHTGLLVERAPGRYGFAHLTFEEYYAGRALAFRGSATDRISEIRRRLHDPRYDEPILLALGLIGTDYVEQIDDVVAKAIYPAEGNPSPYEELLGRDFLFMLRVLADDTPLKTATIDAVITRAIDEWLDQENSRCRFAAYRSALAERLAALSGTKAADRFHAALDSRATKLTPANHWVWCELAGVAARLGPLPAATTATLVTLATTTTATTDPELRIRAGLALARGGALTPPVITALTTLATTATDPYVRISAGSALARGGALPPPVITALTTLATTATDPEVRISAGSALARGGALPPPVITALTTLATTATDPYVRISAGSALARGGALTPPVITALTTTATTATDPYVRISAVSALAHGGALPPPVITALTTLATTATDPEVRISAGSALARGGALTPPVITALTTLATTATDPGVRIRAGSALARGGALTPPVITALTTLATTATDPEVRIRAGSALVDGGALTPPVITALTTLATTATDPYVRISAGSALVDGGALPPPVITALTTLATTATDPYVRISAGSALVDGGALTPPVITALTTTATTATDPEVRARTGSALARGGALTPPVITALTTTATTATDPEVRARTGSALARGGALTPPVITALTTLATTATDPEVRARAGLALGRGGALTPPVITALTTLATTESGFIRTTAVKALRQAPPTGKLQRVFLRLLRHFEDDIRRQAKGALIDLSRRRPELVPDVLSDLARACSGPTSGKVSKWDEAYETLRAYTEVAPSIVQ
ncbi:HEAT repeat domain-containing protein [Micromonospora sp. CA-248260]|uniref:HEAT repeat domain-containing protein n=1 Tax=Micromonospora sp. CA-248260 TaxID=3239962 RepID=UPI003D89C947